VDAKGNIYIGDVNNGRIRMITAGSGTIATFAGTGGFGDTGDAGLATKATFGYIWGLAVDSKGNVYTADNYFGRVWQITSGGQIHAFAGTSGTFGNTGDGGPAISATLNGAESVAVDASGNVLISTEDRIRQVTPDGNIHTLIGGGKEIASGNGQIATDVAAGVMGQVWPAADGSLYYTDFGNHGLFHYAQGQISREGVEKSRTTPRGRCRRARS